MALHFHRTNAEISFGGAEMVMTETLLDGPDWCADTVENGGVSVAQGVGSGADDRSGNAFGFRDLLFCDSFR